MELTSAITIGISIASLIFSAGIIYGKRTKQISDLELKLSSFERDLKVIDKLMGNIQKEIQNVKHSIERRYERNKRS